MINRKFLIIAFFLIPLVLGVFAAPASAQVWDGRNDTDCNESGASPCTFCDMVKVTANIIDFLVELTAALAALMIVYGAIMMMTSGGSEARYRKGKDAIVWAVIGVLVALGSWVIVNTILHILTGDPNYPWDQIAC